MSKFIIGCRSADRLDGVLATMTNMRVRHVPVIGDAS
jgi:predicted transcriptional regulator